MEMKENVHSGLKKVLENIGGNSIHDMFGEPFIAAFRTIHNGRSDEITAAAYTCSLFLSAILKGFPTAKLHTFVHFTKENVQRFSFNCKMYDSIYSHIEETDLEHVALLGKENSYTYYSCSRQDIFEAFDFYTNV